MIDIENEVYSRLADVLAEKFKGINVTSSYVNALAQFPHVSIVQTDSYPATEFQTNSGNECVSVAMFQIDVYSNKRGGSKSECKNIIHAIDEWLANHNFTRLSLTPVPNMQDATIYRLTARYRVATDGTHFYRR